MKRAVLIGSLTAVLCVGLLLLAEFWAGLGAVRPLLQIASLPGFVLALVPPFSEFGWPSYVGIFVVFVGDALFYSAIWWCVLRLKRRLP